MALAGTVVVEVKALAPISAMVLFVAFMLAWLYFLFTRVRWVWIVTVGIYVSGLALDLLSGLLTWPRVLVIMVSLILLLLPVTRRYFA